MREVAGLVRPGVSLSLLDDAAYRLITEAGAKPAFWDTARPAARGLIPLPSALR